MSWFRGLVRLLVIIGTLLSAAVFWVFFGYQESDLAYGVSVRVDPLFVGLGALVALCVFGWVVKGFFIENAAGQVPNRDE